LCELSEFLVLKTGQLGPAAVIGGLPEAAKTVADPEGWFGRAYEELSRWPLPDGSFAVLYRQRRGRAAPLGRRGLTFDQFIVGEIKGSGLRLNVGRWIPALSAWDAASVALDQVSVRGLAVRGVAVDLQNFSFATIDRYGVAEYEWSEMRLMRVDRVTVRSLSIEAADVRAFLEKRVPGLKVESLELEDGTAKVSGNWKGRPFSLEAALILVREEHRLKVAVLSASYMGIPVPAALFRPIKELNLSLDPNPETPFFIDLPGLTIKAGRLTIP